MNFLDILFSPMRHFIQGMGFNALTLFSGGLYQPSQKGKKPGTYQYQPYSGATPPQPGYLRPTEDQLYNILSTRAAGQDVGYDPAWMTKNTDLIKSELGKSQEDQLRSAQGNLASSGLSGNPRAYEALAGRVQRDTSRQLGDELSKISIADLEKRNQERDTNTGRLQAFNTQNFGQANQVADFGLRQYGAEQGNQQYASAQALGQYNTDTQNQNAMFSDLLNTGIGAASLAYGNPGPSIAALSASSAGRGIAPNYGAYDPNMSTAGGGYRQYASARRLGGY